MGYLYCFLNNVFTALNFVFMKRKLDSKDLGVFGLMFYNTLFSFFISFALLLVQFNGISDFFKVLEFPNWHDPFFLVAFLLSSFLGFILNYSQYYCTKLNSALTTTVVGCLKNILSTYAGMFIGGDYVFSMANFVGVSVSVCGSLSYSYSVYKEHPYSSSLPEKTSNHLQSIITESSNQLLSEQKIHDPPLVKQND